MNRLEKYADGYCYVCQEPFTSRVELDHFPVAEADGGKSVLPICIGCHDAKDRILLENWNPSAAFAAVAGVWSKCNKHERLWIAKMIKIASDTVRLREGRVGTNNKQSDRAQKRLNRQLTSSCSIDQVLGASSVSEKSVRSQQTKVALSNGETLGKPSNGRPPYGWMMSKDGAGMIPNEAEQETMRVAKDMHLAGLSLRQITNKLKEKGLVSRAGKTFHAASVSRMLLNGRRNE